VIIYSLLFVIVLLGSYLLFRKKSQSNTLIGSISLILSNLSTGLLARILFEEIEKNGWTRDNPTILIVYLVLIIILWGIIYAILSNFYLKVLDNFVPIVSAISALIFSIAVSTAVCFLVSNYLKVDKISICSLCERISTFSLNESTKSFSFVPKNLQEIYSLPDNTQITLEDKVGERSMLNLINGERAKAGQRQLTENTKLLNLAQIYAQSMASTLRFSHVDVYNNGPEERAKNQNIIYTYLGENLAIAPDIETAHNSLMNSASHRRNVVSPNYHQIGIASYLLSTGSIIVVEEFSD
jgi:uncharacterized protein YkwD